jgi:glycosyltransferase involved in cell wall biosynthesis
MNSIVTVVIATYNSSEFIIETLESVLKQTWRNIELIICDDCSRDSTVEICRNWLEKHYQRFTSNDILTSEKNMGVPANINRGLYISKGDWISFLAGDDTLKPECIEDNISWITTHPEVRVLFSFVEIYNNKFEPRNLVSTTPGDPYNPKGIMASGRSAESQYKMLLIADRIHFTPSLFLHRETLLSVGGFDERFKLLEDHPLWLNLTKNGHKLYFMDKVTVNYRRHSKSIYNTGINYLINPNYFKREDFRKVYIYPNLPSVVRLNVRFYWYASQIFRYNWFNNNKKPNRFLLALLTVYLNPFRYFIWLKKKLNINLKDNEFYT